MRTNNKIVDRENIQKLVRQLKNKNKTIVFTNGCFDILHVGHVVLLEKARSQGDELILGLNTDESVQRLKGDKRPINFQDERARVLAGLEAVSYVTFFSEDTPAELIQEIVPDILVKGGDYELNEIVGRETVEENGGQVITIPLVKGRSTSNLINKIKQNF
ncbi:MAG: D-glycero-beta-D-manno-heptose 1-phosphate adenylyltransferase [Candidatus Marinimicrobia bacterium]|nr:D-glycero-beta-D-manno-heptose 1-phosphate adenylyltransferase [Candidatus Neomarinimicrobiota bacterium]